MTAAPRQLVLDLAHRVAMGRDDFLVSRSNSAAVEVIDGWPQWPQQSLAILGDAGSGKSHLVEVWRARAGGALIPAAELGEASVTAAVAAGALAVEDVDRGIADERILFHLLNLARELKLSLLLTSRAAPGEIAITLPDLRSRMRALGFVRIEPPDSALLSALLVKLFDDRQLKIEPRIIEYLSQHMERSAESAKEIRELKRKRSSFTRNDGAAISFGSRLDASFTTSSPSALPNASLPLRGPSGSTD